MPPKKDEITETKLVYMINNNDYIKLEEILYNHPNINIHYTVVIKAIEKRVNRCFDLLINYENIILDSSIFIQALRMCKVKNEENIYYVNRLLEKNIELEPSEISNLIDFDHELYYKYVEKLNMNEIKKLLSYLTDSSRITYFFEQFNKLSNTEQIDFVKNKIYNSNNNLFIHFIKLEEYDYYTIMCTSIENEKKNNIFNLLASLNNENMLNAIVNYLIKKPTDLTNFENLLSNFDNKLFNIFRYNSHYWNKKILKLKHKLVINCPNIKLLNTTFNNANYVYGYFGSNQLSLKILYYYHKIGFNFDIYSDFKVDAIKYFKSKPEIIIEKIINCVQFGNMIGQKMPEHLREPLYKICGGSPLLDITPVEKDIMK